MPRGIPISGKRSSGGGRKKKYASETVQKWVPVTVADRLDAVYLFLVEVDKLTLDWEFTCKKNESSPRYHHAHKLVAALRKRLDELGVNVSAIYASEEDNINVDDKYKEQK